MPAKRTAKRIATFFGIELKNARTTRGMTQQILAERVDVDPGFVSFLKNGHRQPGLTVLPSVESVLGLDGRTGTVAPRNKRNGRPKRNLARRAGWDTRLL